MKCYIIDDEDNMDDDCGCYRWLVSYDESGDDDEKAIARFREEDDAEKFVSVKNG